MTLLQIAGGQTWPNFLPILGFRPSCVWFLTSSDPDGRFSRSIQHLKDAAHAAGVDIVVKQISTQSSQPTLDECEAALRLLDHQPIDLINLTGGTKAMSMAAHRFACEKRIPTFHLDTRRTAQPFDDFRSAPHATAFPDLGEISARLDVKLALMAQGFPVPASFKMPDENHVAFARQAAEIRRDPDDDKSIVNAITTLRSALSNKRNSFLNNGELRSALQTPISPAPGTPWQRYLQAAADHGVIEALEPAGEFSLVTLDPITSRSAELASHAKRNFKLLEGIWFELAVLDLMRSRSSFSDVCWSVEADPAIDRSASSKGETDLVAFNHKTHNLHFISCKTTGPHSSPLDHIQGLRRRATKEGGEFSKAELWIYHPKPGNHRADLESHCREQGVSLRVFTDPPTP